jgi:uncharacterized phage infection (PIP) family protein YhgE
MADTNKPTQDRRTFLKIGAGVVAGAAVASVVEIPYYSSVIGGNNSSSSSTVSSLSSELASTQSALADTTASLNSATSTIATLNSQLSSTQSALNNASSSLSSANAANSTLSSQLSATQNSLTSASGQVSTLQGQVSSQTAQISSLQSQVTSAQSAASSASSSLTSVQDNLDTQTAFLSLSATEQTELAAVASAIIPTDSSGPGATTAGVVYFIDRQLKNVYGTSGLQYRDGPFIMANTSTPVVVDGITYSGGSVTYNTPGAPVKSYTFQYLPAANVRVGAGTRFQYSFTMKQFWTIGLAGLEAYSNAAYGGNFETLSAANQTAALTDLWNNKPTYGTDQTVIPGTNAPSEASTTIAGSQFGPILPSDFAYELFFMVWNGFWVDPIYGGNKGMVGWSYVGYHGVNLGNFYGEGYTSKQLMVSTTPITLKPASLGQYQKGTP